MHQRYFHHDGLRGVDTTQRAECKRRVTEGFHHRPRHVIPGGWQTSNGRFRKEALCLQSDAAFGALLVVAIARLH
ncbi:hypothetical protein PspS35_22925 [Pseudomonas sp. S35]|nr:hypothetical protein PspS35_22925 [Pseudomonas sp. S35]